MWEEDMARGNEQHEAARQAVRVLTRQIESKIAVLRRKQRSARGAERRAIEANIEILDGVKKTVGLCGWGTGGTTLKGGATASCVITL
jgi:hypothetical protein